VPRGTTEAIRPSSQTTSDSDRPPALTSRPSVMIVRTWRA
jgi:hypothetical protein